MRYDREGGRIATTIFEAAAFQYGVKAICQCGHSAVFNPHGLWWRFQRKHWNDEFRNAAKRFRCLRCGKYQARLEPTSQTVTRNVYPMPDKGEWRRAVNRFRC